MISIIKDNERLVLEYTSDFHDASWVDAKLKKERKVINMTREKVIKVIESTFLDENIDKELYILYGTVLGGACGIIIKENEIEVYISCIAYASKRPEMVLTGKKNWKKLFCSKIF